MNLPGSDPMGEAAADRDDAAAAVRAARRKKLDEVFGEVLPSVTRDEIDDGADGPSRGGERDQWYRDNRPPHHG